MQKKATKLRYDFGPSRIDLGYSQEEIANLMDIKVATLGHCERQRLVPAWFVERFKKLELYLGTFTWPVDDELEDLPDNLAQGLKALIKYNPTDAVLWLDRKTNPTNGKPLKLSNTEDFFRKWMLYTAYELLDRETDHKKMAQKLTSHTFSFSSEPTSDLEIRLYIEKQNITLIEGALATPQNEFNSQEFNADVEKLIDLLDSNNLYGRYSHLRGKLLWNSVNAIAVDMQANHNGACDYIKGLIAQYGKHQTHSRLRKDVDAKVLLETETISELFK